MGCLEAVEKGHVTSCDSHMTQTDLQRGRVCAGYGSSSLLEELREREKEHALCGAARHILTSLGAREISR